MKSLYTSLVAGFVFPLHELFKGHSTVAIKREMEQSQWRQDQDRGISRKGLAKADQDVEVDSYARVGRPEMRLVA